MFRKPQSHNTFISLPFCESLPYYYQQQPRPPTQPSILVTIILTHICPLTFSQGLSLSSTPSPLISSARLDLVAQPQNQAPRDVCRSLLHSPLPGQSSSRRYAQPNPMIPSFFYSLCARGRPTTLDGFPLRAALFNVWLLHLWRQKDP